MTCHFRIERADAELEQVFPPNAVVPIGNNPFLIGRGMPNHLRIGHNDISRRHAVLVDDGDYCYLEDVGSRNGTLVNGERLAPNERKRLGDGDVVQFASALALTFVDPNTTRRNPHIRPLVTRGLWLDRESQMAFMRNVPLSTTPLQFRLLDLLSSREGQVTTRDEIARVLWSIEADLTDAMIENHISRLRKLLEKIDPGHDYIATVRGVGYRFVQRQPE